jgi:hypothetical protein
MDNLAKQVEALASEVEIAAAKLKLCSGFFSWEVVQTMREVVSSKISSVNQPAII